MDLSKTKTKNFPSPLTPASLLDEKKALTAVIDDPRQFTRGFNLVMSDFFVVGFVAIGSIAVTKWLLGLIPAIVIAVMMVAAVNASGLTVSRRKRDARERLSEISKTIAREWVIRAPKSVVPQVRDFLKAIETLPAEHRADLEPMIRAVTDDCILLRSLEDASSGSSCCHPEVLNAKQRIADRLEVAQSASREALALEAALREQEALTAHGLIDTSDIDEAAGVVEMLRASRAAVENANSRAAIPA